MIWAVFWFFLIPIKIWIAFTVLMWIYRTWLGI